MRRLGYKPEQRSIMSKLGRPAKAGPTTTRNIRIQNSNLDAVQALVKQGLFASVSQFVNYAIEDKLGNWYKHTRGKQ